MKWIPIDGSFEVQKQLITFHGQETPFTDTSGREQIGNAVGLVMNDQRFAGGRISATIEFETIGEANACDIVFYYDPEKRWFASACIGGPHHSFAIRHWDGKWTIHNSGGLKGNLVRNRKYDLLVAIRGNEVALSIDGVNVVSATLPFSLPPSQTGIHCIDDHPIRISNYKLVTSPGKAFVVMQFSSPFNEIYEEVIRNVCDEFGIEAHRADETYGPGLIIADVVRDIAECEFVIAEITPANPNVYYEIGYAHAINKPTILLADAGLEKLPFDVSGFRTLFYENSIAGKRKFEESLRKHIAAIFQRTPISGAK